MKPAPEQFRLTPEMNQRLRFDARITSTPDHGNNGKYPIGTGREENGRAVSKGDGTGLANNSGSEHSLEHAPKTAARAILDLLG